MAGASDGVSKKREAKTLTRIFPVDDTLEGAEWERMQNSQWRKALETWNKNDESGRVRIVIPPEMTLEFARQQGFAILDR